MSRIDTRVDDRDDAGAGVRGLMARREANSRRRGLVDVARPDKIIEVADERGPRDAVKDSNSRPVEDRRFDLRIDDGCVRLDGDDVGVR